MTTIWDREDLLLKLQEDRETKKGRTLFDCLKNTVKGERVFCSFGIPIGKSNDGSLSAVEMLRGVTPTTCKNCDKFVTEEEE